MSTSSSDESERKRLSELFSKLNGSSQTLYNGFLQVHGDTDSAAKETHADVQLVWGKKDLVNNATQKFHVQYHVSDVADEGKSAVHRGIFPSSWDVAATSVSPSKQFAVTLKLEKGSDASAPPEGVFSGMSLCFGL